MPFLRLHRLLRCSQSVYVEVTIRYNLNRIVKNCGTIDLWASPQEIIGAKLPKVPTISEKARREHIHFYFDISRAELHRSIDFVAAFIANGLR
jgi:hypothetical protein